MSLSFEALEKIRALRGEADASRERMKGNLPYAERQAEIARTLELTRQILEIEEAAEPPPEKFELRGSIKRLSPEAAAAKAKEIRERPEFFNRAGTRGEDGLPTMSEEAHRALQREVLELDARAFGTEGGGEAA